MDAVDVLKEIDKATVDPNRIWFVATLILTCILVIFLGLITKYFYDFLRESKNYQDVTSRTLEEVKRMVELMKKDLDYHREDINKNSRDIDELKKRRR